MTRCRTCAQPLDDNALAVRTCAVCRTPLCRRCKRYDAQDRVTCIRHGQRIRSGWESAVAKLR